MERKITPVIMAGGTGKRLWPVSRDGLPKQFLPLLAGERSTYQETLLRVADAALFTPPIVITNAEYRFFAEQQAVDVGAKATVLLEPVRRDSALAIATSTVFAYARDPRALILALAADNAVFDLDLFLQSCVEARDVAREHYVVACGIRPSEPNTSYGYIALGAAIDGTAGRAVQAFIEKPDAATAAAYLSAGYLWNSGSLMFSAEVMLGELSRHAPELRHAAQKAVAGAREDLGFVRLDASAYGAAPQISIDYALMEKTTRAAVVEGRFRWSDIGSWDAVWQTAAHDSMGNSAQGAVELLDASNCYVHSPDHLTTVVGAKDMIVVTTKDAVLVASRAKAEYVKELVQILEAQRRPEATQHRSVRRPWGYYDSVDNGPRFQVKRLVVKPGGTLSLQKHLHRSEHWVVVRGTAEVTIDTDVKVVRENESVYIPSGAIHRLANLGKIPLEIIEVQTGSYLGEDDIERFADVYNRVAMAV
jgi:mannose-1-phosphate guanylyltransferase/mannose-6-phosphate isomerase